MFEGEIINGYKILKNFSCAGGGLSKWTFAEKSGKEYFIKEFLSPTYPLPDSLGSEETKRIKKYECEQFELHHKILMGKLKSKSIEGGNLIITLDFFRHKSKYYKITEKIDISSLSVSQISELPFDSKKLILTTIAHSLSILHRENIVHGDLKPDNILIKHTETGRYTSKLIDFDNSYVSGMPSELSEDVVGDMVYYSPELALYIANSADISKTDLTLKSDIFALGLLFYVYWSGKLPDIEKHSYACVYINNENEIVIPRGELPDNLVDIINKMLSPSYKDRPDINSVFNEIKSVTNIVALHKKKEDIKSEVVEIKSVLRGKLFEQLDKAEKKRIRREGK
jgi:serine/threonine protein kinase